MHVPHGLNLTTLTEPKVEPVDLSEAQDHLRVVDDESLSEITLLYTAARQWAEAYTGRKFIRQQLRMVWHDFPHARGFSLPYAPVRSTDALVVRYYEVGSTATVWSSTNYTLVHEADPAAVWLKRDQEFPFVELENGRGVEVDYWVGYSTGPNGVPDIIKAGIHMVAAHWYENRETVVTGTIASQVPLSAKAALAAYRTTSASVGR